MDLIEMVFSSKFLLKPTKELLLVKIKLYFYERWFNEFVSTIIEIFLLVVLWASEVSTVH